jgi:hypothetical protein
MAMKSSDMARRAQEIHPIQSPNPDERAPGMPRVTPCKQDAIDFGEVETWSYVKTSMVAGAVSGSTR